MDHLLDRHAFHAPSVALQADRITFVGQAGFDGCIVVANWKRAEIERLLPEELELADSTPVTRGHHPVVFVFGELSEGATVFGGITLPTGIGYWEFALAVPFVTPRRDRYLHTYIPRMYSSFWPAVWTGNTQYGFSKEMATMGWQRHCFRITAQDDTTLFSARVKGEGNWSRGLDPALEDFDRVRAYFELPILGRKANGTYIRSHFGWNFGHAQVRRAHASIRIDAPLIKGLPPARCNGVRSGTFEVKQMIWNLSWPFPCHSR